MEHHRVSSSCLAEVAYEPDLATLGIRFHNGRSYLYFAVPEPVYRKLLAAPSIGKCFNEEIRVAGYPHRRLADRTPLAMALPTRE
jgi:hypothetical protein